MSHSLFDSLLVLVIDDDDQMRELVVATLRDSGCSTIEARDGAQALDMLDHGLVESALCPDVLLADVMMPNLSGLGVLDALKRAQWSLPVVLMTGLRDESVNIVARRLGAVGVLRKPFEADDLLTAVYNAKAARARKP